MYGDCKTKVNRCLMMKLYGVMHYFDCQGAIMIYNGHIMPDAVDLASKLGIQLHYLEQHLMNEPLSATIFANLPSCEVTPNPATIRIRKL